MAFKINMATFTQLLQERELLAVLIVFLITAYIVKYVAQCLCNVYKHALSEIPGPFLAKLTSNYLAPALVRGDRAQTLLKLHQIYGPLVRVGTNEVSLSDPAMYWEIYNHASSSSKEESFYQAAKFLNHDNIFSMRDKAQHSARRKMQRLPYSQQAVLENENLISETAESLVRRMINNAIKSKEGHHVDVFPLCGLFSLEVICKAAFNKEWQNNSGNDALTLLQSMDGSAKMLPIVAIFPFLKDFGIGRYIPGAFGEPFRQFDKWMGMTRNLLQEFALDELSRDQSQRFMATPLLIAVDSYLNRRLTEDEAVEEAMGIAFAGSGTTSTTLVYLLYNLSLPENSEYQINLRKELLSVPETLKELQQLPYLNAVIKETMRLNPTIISTLPRVLDVNLPVAKSSVTLPAGTIVGMQNYVHHRDPRIFPEPEHFRPERWLDDCHMAEKSITPFSVGPRNCIGQNLARAELYLATSKIFRQLSVKLSHCMKESDMEMEDRFNIAPRGRKLFLDVSKV